MEYNFGSKLEKIGYLDINCSVSLCNASMSWYEIIYFSDPSDQKPFQRNHEYNNSWELSQVPPVQMFSVICSEKCSLFSKAIWDL